MKKMTIIASALAATTLVGVGAFAGGKHCSSHAGEHREMKQMMFEQMLDLSEEKKLAIRALKKEAGHTSGHTDFHDTRHAIMKLDPGSTDYEEQVAEIARVSAEKMEGRIISRAKLQADIYALLDDEQRGKLAEIKAEMSKRMKERREKHKHSL